MNKIYIANFISCDVINNLPQLQVESFMLEFEFGPQPIRLYVVANRICLHTLIFGGKFFHTRHANLLWPLI